MTDQFKYGRGVELTYEALIAVIKQRFPNFIDWDEVESMTPHLDWSVQTEVFGLYFTAISDVQRMERASQAAHTVRRVGQGAPIPTAMLRLDSLVMEDGSTPRCGTFESRSAALARGLGDVYPRQCVKSRGHVSQHDWGVDTKS